MKLIFAAFLVCAGCALAIRNNNLYKNKRIIKVRVPPRPHGNFYGATKGFSRPSGGPVRFKELYGKPGELQPGGFSSFRAGGNGDRTKYQARPLAASATFQTGAGFGHSHKGFVREYHRKFPFPVTYGGSFPHGGSFSSFKFPSLENEIRIAHGPTVPATPTPPTPQLAPSSSSSSDASFSTLHRPNSFHAAPSHAGPVSSAGEGPIREIPAPDLGPKSADGFRGDAHATYGRGPSIDVTDLVSDHGGQHLTFSAAEYYSAFGRAPNLDAITDNSLSALPGRGVAYHDETGSGSSSSLDVSHLENPFDEASAASPSDEGARYKSNEVAVTSAPVHGSGYEVTEEQATGTASTDGGSGSYYYAPDPDPSQPVHKVPPTGELYPDDKLAQTYVSPANQNFQILEGGTVAAPLTTLSTQELFSLMHGFPPGNVHGAVVAEPVVAVLGHHRPGGLYFHPGFGLAQAESVGLDGYAQESATAATEAAGHLQGDAPQPAGRYPDIDAGRSSSELPVAVSSGFSPDEVRDKYEAEASESREKSSLPKASEGSSNSAHVVDAAREDQILVLFNRSPEVPFYATLPNREAAEALATLQAAGSIGSNFVEGEEGGRGEGVRDTKIPSEVAKAAESNDGVRDETAPPRGAESSATEVEIRQSAPLYEASYPASSLLDDSSSPQAAVDAKLASFGKRIRPK